MGGGGGGGGGHFFQNMGGGGGHFFQNMGGGGRGNRGAKLFAGCRLIGPPPQISAK